MIGQSRIQPIHARLRLRRFEVLARYRDELARAAEQSEWREPEDVERAAEQWDVRLLGLLGEADRRTLIETSAALARLSHGTYGLCEGCGGRIDRARLAALPTTAMCIECAHEAEALPARAAR